MAESFPSRSGEPVIEPRAEAAASDPLPPRPPAHAPPSDDSVELPLPEEATLAGEPSPLAAPQRVAGTAAASPLAGAPPEETTEAGQELSALPTQRPEANKPSPFAGLLAEADAARVKKSDAPEPAAPKPRASVPAPRPSQAAPAVAPAPEAPSNHRTLGAYRILSELGSGGMAVVYKALQPALDRLVAIKELRNEYVSDRQISARFEREAHSLATLQHGNIVHIYDFIREVDGAYIVMEFVDGKDLFDLLHEVGSLPPDVAGIVALQLAEGLEYAHYHGIIHRDVKPSNLLISKFGEVKIMDFGIARDPGRSDLTQVGMSLGTPAYMAPEQIRGDKIDFRADIFAFGIVLYEMLTGKKPWGEEEGTTVARKVLYDAYTPPLTHKPDLPPALVHVIDRCLDKDPGKRFATTHELRREVEKYLSTEVRIDPRQRLVVFLRNRGLITEGDASSFVHAPILYDGVLRRRDLGLPSVPPRALLRPLFLIHGAVLAVLVAALILGLTSPFDTLQSLPAERPVVRIVTPAAAPDAPDAPASPAAAGEEPPPPRKKKARRGRAKPAG